MKRKKNILSQEGIGVLLSVLVIGMFLCLGGSSTRSHTAEEQTRLIEQAITRAVVQCYALEGVYPPSMDYISEHYGVKIDERKYFVHYEIFASNIMPNIKVIPKKWGDSHE